MLFAQLKRSDDMLGRLMAAEALGSRKTKKAVEHLQTVLNEDAFFGVRIAAAEALGKIHDDGAFEALKSSIDQADARVRLQVVEELSKFYRSESFEMMQQVLQNEKNPAIQIAAIKALGRYNSEASRQLISQHLKSKSFRNELGAAAVAAMEMQRNPADRLALMEVIQTRADDLPARGLSAALRTLAVLSQDEEERATELDLIKPFVNHPKETVQIGAIRALGQLGDPAAKSVLETFAIKDGPSSRIVSAAEAALKQLQDSSPSAPAEVVQLRKELTEMKKNGLELRKEFDELKSKLESKRTGESEDEKEEEEQEDEEDTDSETEGDA